MEKEKFEVVGGLSLSSEDVKVLLSVLGQYIYEEEHHLCSNGEVINLPAPASWGRFPLAPIYEHLRELFHAFDDGDTLLIKKSCL